MKRVVAAWDRVREDAASAEEVAALTADLGRALTLRVQEPGERAAREAGLRWTREGRHVRIARSPRGMDFNDILIGKVDEGGENSA